MEHVPIKLKRQVEPHFLARATSGAVSDDGLSLNPEESGSLIFLKKLPILGRRNARASGHFNPTSLSPRLYLLTIETYSYLFARTNTTCWNLGMADIRSGSIIDLVL